MKALESRRVESRNLYRRISFIHLLISVHFGIKLFTLGTYLAEIKILSLTAHEVIQTATINEMAETTVICLNWVFPNDGPNMLTMFIDPIAYPNRFPIANILPAEKVSIYIHNTTSDEHTPCGTSLL